ncbi:MAG: hypothetical protein ACYC5H_17770 [Methylovirgula sp.]
MPVDVTLIVTDAPPLITLAAARSLDYLLYPELPVVIPDAVFFCEATNASGKLGAQEILDWYRAHMDAVRIEPTEAFQNATALLAAQGGRMPRDLGERAAVELIRNYPLADTERALLLSDDRDLDRVIVVDPQKLILLTTWDYLRQLEEAQRIQSAEAVLEAVREAGRHPSTRDLWSQHDPEIRDAVRGVIERAHRDSGPKR